MGTLFWWAVGLFLLNWFFGGGSAGSSTPPTRLVQRPPPRIDDDDAPHRAETSTQPLPSVTSKPAPRIDAAPPDQSSVTESGDARIANSSADPSAQSQRARDAVRSAVVPSAPSVSSPTLAISVPTPRPTAPHAPPDSQGNVHSALVPSSPSAGSTARSFSVPEAPPPARHQAPPTPRLFRSALLPSSPSARPTVPAISAPPPPAPPPPAPAPAPPPPLRAFPTQVAYQRVVRELAEVDSSLRAAKRPLGFSADARRYLTQRAWQDAELARVPIASLNVKGITAGVVESLRVGGCVTLADVARLDISPIDGIGDERRRRLSDAYTQAAASAGDRFAALSPAQQDAFSGGQLGEVVAQEGATKLTNKRQEHALERRKRELERRIADAGLPPAPRRTNSARLATSAGEPCPWCRAALVERRGRRGPFVGCSKYPECRYTRDAR